MGQSTAPGVGGGDGRQLHGCTLGPVVPTVGYSARRLAAHLAGFSLTENSFIVCQAGDPPGSPSILNTRISVAHVAHYFKEGCGVMDIQRDLPQLLREEIEAAIQYYLNHREEIEQDLQRSRDIYVAHAPKQEFDPT